jgi:Arc/MetJ family transcription regulator
LTLAIDDRRWRKRIDTPITWFLVYNSCVSRTNIEIDDTLIRKARKLTRLRTKRAIVDRALELLVRTETRKGMLSYYGSGIWGGDLKASRRNRV